MTAPRLSTAILAFGFALGGALLASLLNGGPAPAVAQDQKEASPLRHVVCFKFKDDATQEQIQEIVTGFAALPKKIDGVTGFEWGTNNSPEGLAQGFTHCFVVTFKDAKARDAYLPHPAHKEFVAVLLPRLDKVFVVDYVAQK
jgi:Stress responsive A/B Barrel Domain